MKKNLLIMTAACVALMISGCRKETCNAGVGGDFGLQLYPEHHGEAISGSTFFIEFNTQSAPGSLSDFDLKVEAEDGSEFITLENMRCGDYYVYCVGLDVEDSAHSEIVRGGIPFSVADGVGGVKEIHVPVSE